MTVIVTGGAGFVGSHVVEYYPHQGFDVVCIDNLSRGAILQKDQSFTQNLEYLSRKKNNLLVKADVRDYSEIDQYFKDAEIVVHTAPQTTVPSSVTEPASDFSTNAQAKVSGKPEIDPTKGVGRLITWVSNNMSSFPKCNVRTTTLSGS